MSKQTKAHFAVLGANLIFGSSYSIVKFITPSYIQPFALNAVRVITSLILFWGLFLFKPTKGVIDRKDFPRMIVCALTGVVINQLFFVKGVSLTTPIHSSLLSLGTPIFITLIAAWLLHERFSLLKGIGLLLGVGGAAILIVMKDSKNTASNVLLGDIMVLINAVSYAFYLVLVRPLMQKYSGIQVLRWLFTLGAFIILPIGLPQLMQTDWAAFGSMQWMALLFIGIFFTFVAYLLNLYGINNIGPSATGTYIYTQPLFAAIISILFTGEYIYAGKIMAALLIFTGVYLANYKKKVSL